MILIRTYRTGTRLLLDATIGDLKLIHNEITICPNCSKRVFDVSKHVPKGLRVFDFVKKFQLWLLNQRVVAQCDCFDKSAQIYPDVEYADWPRLL